MPSKDKAKQAAYMREWNAKHPGYASQMIMKHYHQDVFASRMKQRSRYAANRESFRGYRLMAKYNLSVKEWEDLFIAQNGLCKICGGWLPVPPYDSKMQRTAVDHDHATGKVRGLLCHNCNLGVGNLKDSSTLLMKAAEYLRINK